MSHHVPKTDPSHIRGLRSIATVEITKGILVLLGAVALIILIRRDVNFQDIAVSILSFLHVDPDRHVSEMFIDAVGKVSDMRATTVGLTAVGYSALRFIEGYGLWRARIWAEWLALASGTVYLPFELYALVRHPTWLHWIFLLTNLAIIAYIAWVRFGERRISTEALRIDPERAA